MKRGLFIAAVILAATLLISAGFKSELETFVPAKGSVTRTKVGDWELGTGRLERAPGDSVYRAWYTSGSDTGYFIVNVDAVGDTMALEMKLTNVNKGSSEHFRLQGPYSQRPSTGRWKWFNQHEIERYHAGAAFGDGEDIHTDGNDDIANFDSSWVSENPDGFVARHTWTQEHNGVDTLDIRRTIYAYRGAPYFVIRYEFRHTATDNTDSLRFTFREEQVKVANDANSNDLAWVPNYGNVCLRKDFLMQDIGYAVVFMNTGNDSDSADSTFLHPDLKLDAGSDISEFPAGFIAWNPHREIKPLDVAITDLASTSVPSLHADSIFLHAGDYSEPVDAGIYVYFRTPFINLTHDWQTMEYAIGRAKLIGDQMPPVLPEVIFSDGTVWRCPYTRKQ